MVLHARFRKHRVMIPKSVQCNQFIQIQIRCSIKISTSIESHQLVDVLPAHSRPLANGDASRRSDCLNVVGTERTSGVVHDTAVVVVADEGGARGIDLSEVALRS